MPLARWLIALMAPALLLAACGGDGDKQDVSNETPLPSEVAISFAPSGPTTFEVVGGAIEDAIDIEAFMPATVHVRAGDSIAWRSQGYEGHTVSFFPDGKTGVGVDQYLIAAPDTPGAREFNPRFAVGTEAQGSYDGSEYVNSGFFGIPAEQTYTLAFPKAGVYPYLCMVHPLTMRGTVVVDDSEAQVPSSEYVSAQARRELTQYVLNANVAAQDALDARERAATNGAAAWEVSVGIDTAQGQVLSFLPNDLEVATGDSVIFWNSERDFHNVVFVPESEGPPDAFAAFIIKPVEGRLGFRVLIAPDAEREQPPPANFGPDDAFSSGIMGIVYPRTFYQYTFDTPGTYNFYCTIHTNAGMAGRIVVLPGGETS